MNRMRRERERELDVESGGRRFMQASLAHVLMVSHRLADLVRPMALSTGCGPCCCCCSALSCRISFPLASSPPSWPPWTDDGDVSEESRRRRRMREEEHVGDVEVPPPATMESRVCCDRFLFDVLYVEPRSVVAWKTWHV